MQAPDYTQPLIGFREWLVTEVDGQSMLRSAYMGYGPTNYWHRGQEKTALCSHVEISSECNCGLYAYYDRLTFASNTALRYPPNHVRGIVEASGRIILHETGFRAERMQIIAFISRNHGHEALAQEYGVAAVPWHNIREFVEARFRMSPARLMKEEVG
jgi:hypothetical protein